MGACLVGTGVGAAVGASVGAGVTGAGVTGAGVTGATGAAVEGATGAAVTGATGAGVTAVTEVTIANKARARNNMTYQKSFSLRTGIVTKWMESHEGQLRCGSYS